MDPAVIVLLGATSVDSLLGIKNGMTQLRGQWLSWNGRSVMPIFHPSYLLRNPSMAADSPTALTRADLNAVQQRLCER